MRAFIAIELPEEVKKWLSGIQESLGKKTSGPGWVKPGSMHLTLKFLGDIEEAAVKKAAEGLERAAKTVTPFSVTTEKIECRGQRVLWVGFKESRELTSLQERVETELEAMGIERDKRSFSPHLTLRRLRKRKDFLEVKERLSNIDSAGEISFIAGSVELMESELTTGGAIHRTLKKIVFHEEREVDDI